jgi:hypothetical protein
MDLQSKELAELGKGNIDSVVDGDALMITPYGHTFSDLSHTNSSLDFNGSVLMLNVYGEQYSLTDIHTYMTQNPYLYGVLSDLIKINNFYNKNIVLGVYGKEYDKNKTAKIKILKEFKRKINNFNENYDMDYNSKGDNYFCAITRK